MIVLLGKIEIETFTKQIQTGGPVLMQTALRTTLLKDLMLALEKSVEIVTVPSTIRMDGCAEIGISMGARIAMTTGTAGTMSV
uniref:Uncharacterized protein n=1 Tax=Mus spicilegus TaxID=10103 RepID=A0A8C6I2W0_MUSSI